jgi:hypothetical protein
MVQTNGASLGSLPTELSESFQPNVAQNIDGRLEVFVLDAWNLWHTWQTAPNGTWSPWALVAQANLKLSAGPFLGINTNADGRLEVFTIDSQGALWQIWQTSPGGGWSHWSSLDGPSAPQTVGFARVAKNADGRLEVFVWDKDNVPWQIWQTTPNGTWSSWIPLSDVAFKYMGDFLVAKNADGRLEIFTADEQGVTSHIWQSDSGSPIWSDWAKLDLPTEANIGGLPLAVAQDADGRLELFFTDSQGALWHIWQVTPGNWGSDTAHDQAP